MNYLGHGYGRVVFEDNKKAIKIPYNEIGIFQNTSEAEKYNTFGGCLAECRLLDNNWLEMELLDVGDLPYIVTTLLSEGMFCLQYDLLTDRTVHIDCSLDCEMCEHNFRNQITQEQLEQLRNQQPEPHAQVGRDGQGNLKYYDYSDRWERIPDMFVFHTEYLPLFEQYLSENRYDILFCDWVKTKQLPNAQTDNVSVEDKLKWANQTKRRIKLARRSEV